MALEKAASDLDAAVAKGELYCGVFVSADSKGGFHYSKASGTVPSSEDVTIKHDLVVDEDTVFSQASCTKLITSCAAMLCVERGLITLDEDVIPYLPEMANYKVLEGWDGDKPIHVDRKNTITLRQLLSHTSGAASIEAEALQKWFAVEMPDLMAGFVNYFMLDDENLWLQEAPRVIEVMHTIDTAVPLLGQPGELWEYGYGLDWAGFLVEKLTNQSLEDFCQENIFKPLKMNHCTFRPDQHPDIDSKIPAFARRKGDGSIVVTKRVYGAGNPPDMGGLAITCSAPDFVKLLLSLLRNDEKVLKKSTCSEMLDYRLPQQCKDYMNKKEDQSKNLEYDHCLAGQVIETSDPTGCTKGTVAWSGNTGTFWWIDRAAGVCGFYGSQTFLIGDNGITTAMYEKLRKAVYVDLQ